MDFSRFEDAIKAEQLKYESIKNTKDAAKYDEICNGLNKTLGDISLVASYVPTESKKGLISILRALRDFAMELVGYKNSFYEEEKKEEPKIEEAPVEIVQDDSISSEPSQSESQTMEKGNAKTLTLTNPAVPNGNVYNQFRDAA